MARQDIQRALEAWREAERGLKYADGDAPEWQARVDRARLEFQHLSAQHMAQQIDTLRSAERRRAFAKPSTAEYHAAAGEEAEIAHALWRDAVRADEGPREAHEPN